jgi:hypothetical protein
MDITSIFKPLQKFTTYLVDRISLLLITYLLAIYLLNSQFVESFRQNIPYQPLFGIIGNSGITGDNQTILVVVVALFILVAILEIHEKILGFLNMFSPIAFSTNSYQGDDVFVSYAPLLWRGYCHKLNLGELQNLFQLTVSKLQVEDHPRTRQSEMFDYIPGWLFMLLLTFFFLPREMLAASGMGFLKMALFLTIIGFVWELYRGRSYAYESSRVQYLALAALIERKSHDFESLSEQQNHELEERRKMFVQHSRPWRVPVIQFPWITFMREVAAYFRSRAEIRALKAKSRGS